MIYTFTASPCLDYYVLSTAPLDIGKTNRADSAHIKAGGKGANVSLALKKLGCGNVITLLAKGGKNGERIVREFVDNGLECKAFEASGESRINLKINAGQIETEMNAVGADISKKVQDEIISYFSKATPDDVIVLAGSIPPTVGEDFYARIIEATNSENIAVDCTGKALRCALKSKVWLVKPNIDEICELFGKPVTLNQLPECAKALVDMGARHALVSAGANGAVLACGGKVWAAQAPKGRAVSSTGAGDTMLAAFIHWYKNEKCDINTAFKMAVAAGSAKTFFGDFPEKSAVLALAEKITVRELF